MRRRIIGSDGSDRLIGGNADEDIFGRGGNDMLFGMGGNDRLWGGWGNDSISGGAGDDQLRGDDGDDILQGGTGSDLIIGGAGHDRMYGGGADRAKDTFSFGSSADSSSNTEDLIFDFEAGVDKIDLTKFYDIDARPLVIGRTPEGFGFSEVLDGRYIVKADVDGDRVADFAIKVQLTSRADELKAEDFIF